jgi:hypothetical protein
VETRDVVRDRAEARLGLELDAPHPAERVEVVRDEEDVTGLDVGTVGDDLPFLGGGPNAAPRPSASGRRTPVRNTQYAKRKTQWESSFPRSVLMKLIR